MAPRRKKATEVSNELDIKIKAEIDMKKSLQDYFGYISCSNCKTDIVDVPNATKLESFLCTICGMIMLLEEAAQRLERKPDEGRW